MRDAMVWRLSWLPVMITGHLGDGRPGLAEEASLREKAAVEALYEAVDTADSGYRKDAVAAAWHAEPVLRIIRAAVAGPPGCE